LAVEERGRQLNRHPEVAVTRKRNRTTAAREGLEFVEHLAVARAKARYSQMKIRFRATIRRSIRQVNSTNRRYRPFTYPAHGGMIRSRQASHERPRILRLRHARARFFV
jgi:hypothetical protein